MGPHLDAGAPCCDREVRGGRGGLRKSAWGGGGATRRGACSVFSLIFTSFHAHDFNARPPSTNPLHPPTQAIALAPTYFLAHVYLGSILLLSTAVYNAHPLVQRSYAAAWELAGEHDLTARERGHLAAFQALNAGPTPDFDAAAEAWEAVLDAHPRDLLAIRSAHDAYIILGDTANLQASLA